MVPNSGSNSNNMDKDKARRCGIVGVAVQKGQPKFGPQLGPGAFRKAGLVERLQNLGHIVHDYGDVCDVVYDDDTKLWYRAKNSKTVAASSKASCNVVSNALQQNSLVINLGGDHSMAIGTFQAHLKRYPDACLVWVDAHADLNMPFTTPSGNLHGMPVGLHVRELAESVWMPDYFDDWFDRRCSARNIAYLALRDLDDDERRIIKHLNIPSFSMHDIDKFGVAHCLKKCLDVINPNLDKTIHLSFDIDSIDPSVCPSTGTPVPGGLSIREGLYICEELRRTGMLRSVDLAEVNPAIGTEEDVSRTLHTSMLFLETCAGDVRDLSVTPQHWLSKVKPSPLKLANFGYS